MAGFISIITDALKTIENAMRKLFHDKIYLFVCLFSTVMVFAILLLLPVGNFNIKALYYQLTELDAVSLLTMGLFSILLGIILSANIYLINKTHPKKGKILGVGIISILSSGIAGIFGSAVCVACVSLLIGFLGLPFITALIAFRKELFLISAVISAVSLYAASKAIVEHERCKVCRI